MMRESGKPPLYFLGGVSRRGARLERLVVADREHSLEAG